MTSFRSFTIVWLGQFLSRLGSGMTAFALGVYVYRAEGSAAAYSIVLFAAFFPPVLIAPLGGVIADRVDRLKVMWIGDIASALGVVGTAMLVFTGNGTGPLLYVAVAATAVCGAFHAPAFKAVVSELVDQQDYGRAAGMIQLAEAARYVLSPVIAALLMARFPIHLVLIGDAATFCIGALSVLAVGSLRPSRGNREQTTGTPLHAFYEGIRSLRGNRAAIPLLLVTSLVTFATGVFQALFGPFVLSQASAETFGRIQSIAAIGMVFASVVVSGLKREYDRWNALRVSLVALGAFFIGIAASPGPVMITCAAFMLFATLPITNTNIEVLFRRAIHGRYEARAWALISFITQIGLLVGLGTAGFLADVLTSILRDSQRAGQSAAILIIAAGAMLVILGITASQEPRSSARSQAISLADSQRP